MNFLREHLSFDAAHVTLEESENKKGGKDLYLRGICIQGDRRNANERIYPFEEIKTAVHSVNERIKGGYSVLGEVDHPDDLQINLDRVSHMITEMWMDGANGYGKLKILPTPMGKIIETMLLSDVRLGVSSRGKGNVNEATGYVSEFEIVTVDCVAQPSAPDAYPVVIYEGIHNLKGGLKMLGIAEEACDNKKVQKYLEQEVLKLIKDLKIR